MPALRRERVGADHEPVGKFGEDLAPLGRHLAVGPLVATKRQVTPQALVLAQHVANLLGPFEPGMRPEYSRLRILPEQAFDRILIGVRVQDQLVLLGERHHAPRYREIRVGAVQVKLADRDIARSRKTLLQERHDRVVADPRTHIAASAIRTQLRQDQVGRLCDEPLRALVAGTGHQRALQACLAQDENRFLRRQVVPGIVAVMNMGIEKRKFGRGRRRPGSERHRSAKPSTERAKPPSYCALSPRRLITFAESSISVCTNFVNSAGDIAMGSTQIGESLFHSIVCSSRVLVDLVDDARRRSAEQRRRPTGCSRNRNPLSATVGTLGSALDRLEVLTASARSLPSRMFGSAPEIGEKKKVTRPASLSLSASGVPL